jgi:hypothetical protein
MRRFVRHVLALPVILLLGTGAAWAADACPGEYSAAALLPWPPGAVVGLDLGDSSPASARLAAAFTRGMQDAGATVQGAQPATVKLRLTWQVLGQGGSNPGGGNNPLVPMQPGPPGTGGQVWSGNSQTFLQGGIVRAMPDMPNYDMFAPGQSASSGLLIFRAEARDPSGNTIFWIASVQCTLVGADNPSLAYRLGEVIGGALGQVRSRVAM